MQRFMRSLPLPRMCLHSTSVAWVNSYHRLHPTVPTLSACVDKNQLLVFLVSLYVHKDDLLLSVHLVVNVCSILHCTREPVLAVSVLGHHHITAGSVAQPARLSCSSAVQASSSAVQQVCASICILSYHISLKQESHVTAEAFRCDK